jgi:tetratricopeptide (TPR) repeat protein
MPISEEGKPVVDHDIWNTRVTAIDRQVAAGRADLARFAFVVPANARSPVTLSAKLNYRRFNNRFMEFVAKDSKVGRSPVVEMAAASVSVQVLESPRANALARPLSMSAMAGASAREAVRLRWRAYGVALFDQQQYEAAVQAFGEAVKLAANGSPEEASSRIDLAMTYLRMERAGSSQSVIDRAAKSVARALEISPDDGRARYIRALLNIKRFRYGEAVAELEALGRKYPRDRQVWSQLASIYLLQWRDAEARSAYEHVVEIDPDDTEAHMKLAGLYWRFGLIEMAKREQDAYQARHTDTVAETMRRSYLRAHPELYATWPWREFGDNPIGSMP